MNGEDDDGNPVGSTAFQHAERMAAALAAARRMVELFEHVRIGETTHAEDAELVKLCEDRWPEVARLALSATARADAAEAEAARLREREKHMVPISNDCTTVFVDGQGDVALDWDDALLKRADLAERRLVDAALERHSLKAQLIEAEHVIETAKQYFRLEHGKRSKEHVDLTTVLATYRAATERKP